MSHMQPALALLGLLGSVSLGWQASLPVAADRSGRDMAQAAQERGPPGDAAGHIVSHRAADGLFYVTLRISATDVRFMVDTGASDVVLSAADARRIGVTATSGTPEALRTLGAIRPARRIVLPAVSWRGGVAANVDAIVVGDGEGVRTSLLGHSMLQRFRSIRIDADRMTLR